MLSTSNDGLHGSVHWRGWRSIFQALFDFLNITMLRQHPLEEKKKFIICMCLLRLNDYNGTRLLEAIKRKEHCWAEQNIFSGCYLDEDCFRCHIDSLIQLEKFISTHKNLLILYSIGKLCIDSQEHIDSLFNWKTLYWLAILVKLKIYWFLQFLTLSHFWLAKQSGVFLISFSHLNQQLN